MSDVGFGPESKKVRELARSLAKGTDQLKMLKKALSIGVTGRQAMLRQ